MFLAVAESTVDDALAIIGPLPSARRWSKAVTCPHSVERHPIARVRTRPGADEAHPTRARDDHAAAPRRSWGNLQPTHSGAAKSRNGPASSSTAAARLARACVAPFEEDGAQRACRWRRPGVQRWSAVSHPRAARGTSAL